MFLHVLKEISSKKAVIVRLSLLRFTLLVYSSKTVQPIVSAFSITRIYKFIVAIILEKKAIILEKEAIIIEK